MSKLSRRHTQTATAAQAEVRPFAGLARLQPHAAGADSGAHEIVVCVPGPDDTQIVRTFGTYTADLESLAAWLKVHAVETIAQTIIAEVGSSLERFPSAKHFCSWLGLAPHNDISGGKVLRSYRLKNHNRAGQAFIQAAAALIRSDTVFGACYRRLKSRLGPAQALIATAHKLARVVYKMLKHKVPYAHTTAQAEEERLRDREIAYLKRKATKLGLILADTEGTVVS